MNCRNYTKNNVGVERTKVKRVEMESLVLEVINNQKNQILSKKHEAYTLQGIGSSQSTEGLKQKSRPCFGRLFFYTICIGMTTWN